MDLSQACDDRLLQQARSQAEALGRLYEQLYPAIYRYCLHRLFVRSWAEDATSATFLQMAQSIRDFRSTRIEQFRTWLFRIATNQVNAMLRSHRRDRKCLQAAADQARKRDGADGNGHEKLDWPQLYQAIAMMSTRDQTLIVLRYLEDHSPAQVAEILGSKSGTVRTALSRALARLQERLTNLEAPAAGRIQT
ncbi:MAG: RNA polymerase sigma factor [Phycisphaerae bacterium]